MKRTEQIEALEAIAANLRTQAATLELSDGTIGTAKSQAAAILDDLAEHIEGTRLDDLLPDISPRALRGIAAELCHAWHDGYKTAADDGNDVRGLVNTAIRNATGGR